MVEHNLQHLQDSSYSSLADILRKYVIPSTALPSHGVHGLTNERTAYSVHQPMRMSRVIVSVEDSKSQRKGENRKKKKRRRLEKTSKTLLEKIYHNLKRFAKVTLSTKKEAPEPSATNVIIDDDITVEHLENKTIATNTGQTKTFGLDIGFGENLIDLRQPVGHDKDWNLDIGQISLANTSSKDSIALTDYDRDIFEELRTSKQEKLLASQGKGRSLPLEVWEEERKIIQFDPHFIGEMREINFFNDQSWLEDQQLTLKKTDISIEKDAKFQFLEFTNILIIGVGVSFFFILSAGMSIGPYFVSRNLLSLSKIAGLLTVLVWHLRQSPPGQPCDLSDTSDTLSAMTGSTQVTWTGREEPRQVQHSLCEDLYSLDSDYFLSSLEDISVQL